MYADDTILVIKNKDINTMINMVNVQLEKIHIYCKNNHLSLNENKSKIIFLVIKIKFLKMISN